MNKVASSLMRLLPSLVRALPAAAALASVPAAAQPETGAGAEARAFVEAIAGAPRGQVARFHDPVCPIAEGLPEGHNAALEARLRELAAAAGAQISRDRRCRANLVVLVADDPEAAVAALRRRRPDIFGGLPASDISRALGAAGPVRSWRSSEIRRIEAAAITEQRYSALNQDVHLHHGVPASLLRQPTRRELRLSVVMFDLSAIDGLTLMQIADHAAMLGLSSTDDPGQVAVPSILGLFTNASSRAPAASRWDLFYLRALYGSDGSLAGAAQRGTLARLIERQFASRP